MKEFFCEDPTYLYVTAGIVELLMVFIYFKTRSRKLAAALLIPVVFCGTVAALDHFIITDREQITQITQEIAASAVEGDLGPAGKYLDNNYLGYAGDKSQILELAGSQIKQLRITSCKLTEFNIEVTGKQAEMTVTSTFRSAEHGDTLFCLQWTVYWVKTPDGWRIRDTKEPQRKIPGFGA